MQNQFNQRGRGFNAYAPPRAVGHTSVDTRAKFISRTYAHLLGAILAFTAIEVALFRSGIAYRIAGPLVQNWIFVLGGMVIGGYMASKAAFTARTKSSQYLALAGYVGLQAVIFVPLLVMANLYAPGAIQSAAITTVFGFGALTGVAMWTRKDFSFLGSVVRYGMFMALGFIVLGMIFGFTGGTAFSVVMVGLGGAAVLYDTSNVLHRFPEDKYVGASLQLFASIALIFWYVLQIFMGGRD